MALYLGSSEKLKVIMNDEVLILHMFSKAQTTNGIRLVSSDGYVLKDITGLYLTTPDNNNVTTAQLGIAVLGTMMLGVE